MFHGGPNIISEITAAGLFGGIFATSNESAARSHGDVLHVIESPRPLSNYVLNYEIDGAYDVALELCDGDESRADTIMSVGCESDDGEDGWELQRLRGKLAARLGYTSVEMRDEHGTTWLCLPGCAITVIE